MVYPLSIAFWRRAEWKYLAASRSLQGIYIAIEGWGGGERIYRPLPLPTTHNDRNSCLFQTVDTWTLAVAGSSPLRYIAFWIALLPSYPISLP